MANHMPMMSRQLVVLSVSAMAHDPSGASAAHATL